jgi:hypothetical protein
MFIKLATNHFGLGSLAGRPQERVTDEEYNSFE